MLTLNSRFVANKVRGIHTSGRLLFRSPNAAPASAGSAGDPGTWEPARLPGGLLWCGPAAGASPGGMGPPQLGSYSGAPSGSLRAKGTRILSPFSTSEWMSFTQNQNYPVRGNAQNHATHKHVTFFTCRHD